MVKRKLFDVIMFSTVNTSAVKMFLDSTPPDALGFRTCHRYKVVKVIVRSFQKGHRS